MRTTVVSLVTPRSGAGDGPCDEGAWGLEAERGSWWCGPLEERESGWREEEGRWVTK